MTVPQQSRLTVEHNGSQFVVADKESSLAYIAEAKAREAAVEHPGGFTTDALHVPPASYSLAQYQTGFRNQGDRGSCWAFGGAAAVEAAYKRKYGVTLDLAEQYICHVAKVQELAYNTMDPARSHENNSTLWDAQGASDIVTKLVRSAVCEEGYAPYLFQSANQPASDTRPTLVHVQGEVASGASLTVPAANPAQSVMDQFEFHAEMIPDTARAQCRYKVTGTGSPSSYDAQTMEALISQNYEVIVDIHLYYTADKNGIWQYDANNYHGDHVLLLIGYDRNQQYFLAKNSWNDADFTKIGYGFIDHCCNWAHYVTGVADPKAAPDKRAYWMGQWNMDHDGWRGSLCFRRHTDYRASDDGKPTRLGTYVRDNVSYDVNGHFEANYSHCVLFIAPSAARVAPGVETGQRFDFYCFTGDIEHAAGRTTWNNTPFGAVLSRPALSTQQPAAFQAGDWIGSYAMNHDGWQGKLSIRSVAPLQVTYTNSAGQSFTGTGTVNGHEMSVKFPFTGNTQAFDLLYHTREKGVISGTTVWDGQTFGVVALLSG